VFVGVCTSLQFFALLLQQLDLARLLLAHVEIWRVCLVPRKCLPGSMLNQRVADRALFSAWNRRPTCPARPAGEVAKGARWFVTLQSVRIQKGLSEAEKN
jgi:hypothetical protein